MRRQIDWQWVSDRLLIGFIGICYMSMGITMYGLSTETEAQRREIETYELCNGSLTSALHVRRAPEVVEPHPDPDVVTVDVGGVVVRGRLTANRPSQRVEAQMGTGFGLHGAADRDHGVESRIQSFLPIGDVTRQHPANQRPAPPR